MRKSRLVTIGTGLIAVVLVATAAWAWWETVGGGSGTATVDTPEEVTITDGTVATVLFPTGEAMGDLALTVTNPNVYELRIYELELDTSQGFGGYSQNAVDCDVTFTDQTTEIPWTVSGSDDEPLNGVLQINLDDSVTMGEDAEDSCQEELFTVYVKTGA